MFFRANSLIKIPTKFAFLLKLSNYKFTFNDAALDLYFRENYKKTLYQMCYSLIENCLVAKDKKSNIVFITFQDRELDKIAQIITYGNANLHGSKILRYIFEK